MLKKIGTAAALFLVSTSLAYADLSPYIGVNLGLGKESDKLKDPTGGKTHLQSTGLLGGFFAGVGTEVSTNIYMGGEAFALVNSNSTNTREININATTTTSAKITDRYSYGFSFIPGFKQRDCMLFGRLGIIRTRFRQTQDAAPAGLGVNNSTVAGAQVGVGFQQNVTQNSALRIEIDHTSYHSFTSYGNKISPRNNQVMLGLAYNIN